MKKILNVLILALILLISQNVYSADISSRYITHKRINLAFYTSLHGNSIATADTAAALSFGVVVVDGIVSDASYTITSPVIINGGWFSNTGNIHFGDGFSNPGNQYCFRGSGTVTGLSYVNTIWFTNVQAALDTGSKNIEITNSYTVSSSFRILTSGQHIYSKNNSILTATTSTTSIFIIGYNGRGFVKTDDITISGITMVGLANGTDTPPPYGINIHAPTTIPYSSNAGCSRIKIIGCKITGFCYSVVGTGADDIDINSNYFGGNYYYNRLSAGGYGVLMQTCFNVKIHDNTFIATSNDRHAIYISADPTRKYNNDNVCKDVFINRNYVDWTGVNGVGASKFESCLMIRSSENISISNNIIKGGYGGIDYDSENGNGNNVLISNNMFVDQTAYASERGAITFLRSSGSYATSNITVTGNDIEFNNTNMNGIVMKATLNSIISGNTVSGNAGVSLIKLTGNNSNTQIFGNKLFAGATQYATLLFSGVNNDHIKIGGNDISSRYSYIYKFFTMPTNMTWTFH